VVAREREITTWSRKKKIRLIEATSRGWEDLAVDGVPGMSMHDPSPSLRSGSG